MAGLREKSLRYLQFGKSHSARTRFFRIPACYKLNRLNRKKTYPSIRALALSILFCGLMLAGHAQSDSIANAERQLNSVTITGTNKILFDPALRPRLEVSSNNGTLAQVLQYQNILFLKTYGPGLLSSTSSRGTDPAHTPILWNGFSLQNTVNANPDPAIESIPGNYTAAYYPGGQSGLFGSGAMGGTIHLSPTFSSQEGILARAGFEVGSFGRYSENFSLGYQGKKTYISAGLRLYKAENNFRFVNRAKLSKPIERLEDAAANGTSFNTDFKKKLKKGGAITASLWYQFNNRKIPPTMNTISSHAEQIDENIRSMVGWSKGFKKGYTLSAKTAFLYDYLFYNDNVLSKPSLMVQYASLSRVEYDHRFLKSHHVLVGLNHSYYKVFMEEFKGLSPIRNQTALFIGYKYTLPRNWGEAAIQGVEEFTDGRLTPFCPAISLLLKPKPYLPIRVRVNRNYRQPTFNDMYWVPGGNPDLRPEVGFSQEAGMGFEKKYNKPSGEFDVSLFGTGFHHTINNRIAWIPGPAYWAPENIDRTRGYGGEADVHVAWKNNHLGIVFSGHYSYTKSIRAKERFDNDPAFGKQLIYIPQHLAGVGLEFTYKNTSIFYRIPANDIH